MSLYGSSSQDRIPWYPLPCLYRGETKGTAGTFTLFPPDPSSQRRPRSPLLLIKPLDNGYNRSYTFSMKTAISIPDKVFRSADALAKRLGISRSELYSTAIAEFLSKHQGRHVTARLDALYAEEDSSLSPNLIQLQAKSLARGEW